MNSDVIFCRLSPYPTLWEKSAVLLLSIDDFTVCFISFVSITQIFSVVKRILTDLPTVGYQFWEKFCKKLLTTVYVGAIMCILNIHIINNVHIADVRFTAAAFIPLAASERYFKL